MCTNTGAVWGVMRGETTGRGSSTQKEGVAEANLDGILGLRGVSSATGRPRNSGMRAKEKQGS